MQMVAVANDITFNSGAFSPREDAVFRAVTEYALEERLPLLYLAANSGARVGLANEVKKNLQACHLLLLSCKRRLHILCYLCLANRSFAHCVDACDSSPKNMTPEVCSIMKQNFMQVEWTNPKDPSKGFQYLYLSDKDYKSILDKASHIPLKASSIMVKGIESVT